MKIILIILGLLILISKLRSSKNLFKSKKKIEEEMVATIEKSKESISDKQMFNGLMFFGMGLFSFGYILFYLLSAIYVSEFWFVILSILLIFDTIRGFIKACSFITDISKVKYESILYRIFNYLIDIIYIVSVFYYLYLTW